jgi:hypothetical protein
MRLLRALWLVSAGMFAGFSAAAAVVKRALPSRGDAESDEVALVAIFSGKELRSSAKAFRGGSMLAWFGGIAVDLREAHLAPGARLSVQALFGGIAIKVPPDWHVESHVTSLGGGVKVKSAAGEDSDAPRLVLDGSAVFGGVAVGSGSPDIEPVH